MPWHRTVAPLALALAGVLAAADARAAPFGSAFTYQGEIRDAGEAPTGAYDLRFRAYRAADDAGAPLAELVVEDVAVVEGIFTARVDFGAGFFVGDAIFVELGVRPGASADPNAFEALAPRQELTPAPYALKTAPGSVTDLELAPDAVAGANVGDGSLSGADVADGSLDSADVGDGSLAPSDLALAAFNQTFWRVGGNAGVGTSVLGTTDNTRLALQSGVGVTINGPAVNNNTELTIRGNAVPAEGNADLSLWPRGGTALFNLSALGADPASARFAIHAVGTSPFTGFLQRAIMDFDGSFGLGTMQNPAARLHVRRAPIGFDAGDLPESVELALEDANPELLLVGDNADTVGALVALAEMGGGAIANQWSIGRRASMDGGALQLAYGTAASPSANPVLFQFGNNATLALGDAPPDAVTELFVSGTPGAIGNAAELALQPRGVPARYVLGTTGNSAATTGLSLSFDTDATDPERRLRLPPAGGLAVGQYASVAHADSVVFADEASTTPFTSSAANQFLVRATNGVALNAGPVQLDYELSVLGAAPAESAQIAMAEGGSDVSLVMVVDGAGSTDTRFRLLERDASGGGGGFSLMSRLWIEGNGFVGFNGGFAPPNFPLTVGFPGGNNGNGAFLSTGGTWTNASSRALKEAFTAIDVEDVLARVLALGVTRWRYRSEGDDTWHIGPVAEDFHAAFGLGGDARYIGSVDADGVALAAIQGLARRDDARILALERENAALRTSLEALSSRLEVLEAADARR